MRNTAKWLSLLGFFPGLVWGVNGTLTPVQGTVSILKSAAMGWEEVSKPIAVEEGVGIRTGSGSSAFLVTPDDHRVAIGADAEVTLQRLSQGETQVFLKAGSIRSKVRKLHIDQGQYYRVQTPTAVVAVRGTDFAVLQAQASQIHVYEGIVDLSALKKDIRQAITQINAGQSARVEISGEIKPPEAPAAPPPQDKKEDKREDKKGNPNPPPPPPPPTTAWWNGPEQMKQDHGLFDPPKESGPEHHEPGPPPPLPTTGVKLPPPDMPDTNPYNGGPTVNNPNPPPPGGDTTGNNPTQVGLSALIATMNSQGLQNQAQAILVADLFQRNEVRIDPLTGQYRQFADAIASAGTDGIRFLNATMIPGHPETLNYTVAYTKFNTTLPPLYTDATKSAFFAGNTPPSYWATDYQTDVSNTVDHLSIAASGGSPMLNTAGRYTTKFTDIATKINGIELWHTQSGVTTYRGGALPGEQFVTLGGGDAEKKETYASGDFFSVRHSFFDADGHFATPSSQPATQTASQYVQSLYVRTTIRSNLLHKGSLDIFGTVAGRVNSGLMNFSNTEADSLLKGLQLPNTSPLGLSPNS